jgi:hypothetical protein
MRHDLLHKRVIHRQNHDLFVDNVEGVRSESCSVRSRLKALITTRSQGVHRERPHGSSPLLVVRIGKKSPQHIHRCQMAFRMEASHRVRVSVVLVVLILAVQQPAAVRRSSPADSFERAKGLALTLRHKRHASAGIAVFAGISARLYKHVQDGLG